MKPNSPTKPRPARKIGVKSRGVTGTVPSMGDYESSLERDVMELFQFDLNVESFLAQPLTIKFHDKTGKSCSYTPDGLVQFKPQAGGHFCPILYEVKFRADFRENWKTLMPKFRAAKNFCLDRNWRFEVYTEREVRTPYLNNVKFLWPFRNRPISEAQATQILTVLADLEEADPDFLLCALCRTLDERARLIPAIWYLVSIGAIGCDLAVPLTMRSRFWPTREIPS